jgi:phage shock protein PspC (stress-responsive transcriptional regulator)
MTKTMRRDAAARVSGVRRGSLDRARRVGLVLRGVCAGLARPEREERKVLPMTSP